MNIFARQHTAYHSDIEKALGKKLSEVSKEEILALFPENMFERWAKNETDLKLTVGKFQYDKTMCWWQRLNCIWVLPLYVVVIGPVHWIATGKWGVERTSNFGKLLKKLVGE